MVNSLALPHQGKKLDMVKSFYHIKLKSFYHIMVNCHTLVLLCHTFTYNGKKLLPYQGKKLLPYHGNLSYTSFTLSYFYLQW